MCFVLLNGGTSKFKLRDPLSEGCRMLRVVVEANTPATFYTSEHSSS